MAALDSKSYLIDALAQLERHAKLKLRESRKLWRAARRATREGSYSEGRYLSNQAKEFETGARQDMATIQELLADGRLNR